MFKNIRYKIAALVSAFAMFAVPMAVPALASAATSTVSNCLSQGATGTGSGFDSIVNGGDCTSNASTANGTTLNSLVKTVINVFSLIVGIVSVIMIIVGGLRYITSGGDSGKVGGAKNTIIYAIIGLVVVALAQFIVQFVLNKANTLS